MSGNPAFFDYFRLELRKRLNAHARASKNLADKATIVRLAAELVAEATSLGICDDITDADRDDVVSRVCSYVAARQQGSRKATPTSSNQALWDFACPRSRKIALASARRHGGQPDRQELEDEIRAMVAAYRSRTGFDAPDDDAEGIVKRLVGFRVRWKPTRAAFASDKVRRPGATASARRILTDTVRDLVDNTAGPEPRLYKGLHKARPSRTLGTGKQRRVMPRRATTLRVSTSAVHAVLVDRAGSQKRRAPSRSAVARAVRDAVGAPDREVRLAALPAAARRIYEVLTAVLPGNRISVVRLVDLSERIWGTSVSPSTLRGHRSRCIRALEALTAARIDINAVVSGDVAVVGRARRVPSDVELFLRTLPVRELVASRVALKSGVWASPEGKIAASYLRIMAQEAQADDYDDLSIFLGNPRLIFVRDRLRSDPSWAEDPYGLLEQAERTARHVVYNPTVAECKRDQSAEVGWPEQEAAAKDLLLVLDAACVSFVAGWQTLISRHATHLKHTNVLESFIAQIHDPEEWCRLIAGHDPESGRETGRCKKGARQLTRPPSR